MTTLTLELTDEQAQKWAQEAERLHITPEQLVTQSVEKLLTPSAVDGDFLRLAEEIISEDRELLERLA